MRILLLHEPAPDDSRALRQGSWEGAVNEKVTN